MTRAPHHRKTKSSPPPSAPPPIDNTDPTPVDGPVFGEPAPTADPEEFRVPHPSDSAAYAKIDALNAAHKLNPLPFPAPRGLPEPQLTLAQIFGPNGDAITKQIEVVRTPCLSCGRRHRVGERARSPCWLASHSAIATASGWPSIPEVMSAIAGVVLMRWFPIPQCRVAPRC